MKRTKYQLPNYFKLKQKFDLNLLQKDLSRVSNLFQDVLSSNRELCSNNHELATSVYDHYEQVSLTTYAGPAKEALTAESCAQLGESAGVDEQLSKHQKYKLKLMHRVDRPELDERNYTTPISEYKGSYFESCVNSFKAKVMRVRLVKLKPEKSVDWHIDYDPTYATRIIVPIQTNPLVINRTKRRGTVQEIHLPADGHAWFLNTGLSHSVVNGGDTDRIILMFSLDGQEDLDEIPSEPIETSLADQ